MRFSAFHAAERFHPPGKYIVRPTQVARWAILQFYIRV